MKRLVEITKCKECPKRYSRYFPTENKDKLWCELSDREIEYDGMPKEETFAEIMEDKKTDQFPEWCELYIMDNEYPILRKKRIMVLTLKPNGEITQTMQDEYIGDCKVNIGHV